MLITSGKPGQPQVWHMADMSPEDRQRQHGRGWYEPLAPVVAGDYVSLTFTFEIGETAIPSGGRLAVAWRWPIDWADLQTEEPAGDGYMRVLVNPASNDKPVDLSAAYYRLGGFDPWHHHLELTVNQGVLTQGDRVQLICGDRSGGGRGWRAPTLRVKSIGFLMLINPDNRPDNGERWIRLLDAPSFPTIPGPPVRLVAIAPSDSVVEQPVAIIVRAEDRWGNATLIPQGPPHLGLSGSRAQDDVPVTLSNEVVVCQDPPAYHFSGRFHQAGSYRLSASVPGTDLAAESNPGQIHATQPTWPLFWGDLHSGQTEIGCGAGTMHDHFTFARDAAGLQFLTHQANDHYITLAAWQHTHEETAAFHEPGRFVTFLGCEWSAYTKDGGDRNVIYRFDEPRLRRSGRFFTETEPDPEPDLTTATAFLDAMRNETVLINMHAGGRPTNLAYHAPEIERLAEIHSTHGTSEWFVLEALQRGYKIGITAGADGVMGRPGGCHPGWRLNRNVRSGLTAVYAEALTREALWAAFQARRCYGTTGERIRLWVDIDGQPMGADHKTAGQPLIHIAAEGTAPLEVIELWRGTTVLWRWQIAPLQSFSADTKKMAGTVRILWGGTERRGTARDQRVTWDGTLQVTAGRVAKVDALGFQSPEDYARLENNETVTWRSATAGNTAGLVLQIEGDKETVCHFSSGPATFSFRLNQVNLVPMVIDAGGVGRQVTVGPAPADDGPRQVDLTYRDLQPSPGEWPYWVRLVQIDQARAWSSPVYVKYQVDP